MKSFKSERNVRNGSFQQYRQLVIFRFFRLDEHETSIRTEALAGLTTFLTMAYIIFVNPAILSDGTGMPFQPLVSATILASVIGTLLVGLMANVPLAMAPGMGLNAMFTYMLIHGYGLSWQEALGVIFLSGVFFAILTVTGVRARIVEVIPLSLRLGIGSGIGVFITLIGLESMRLVVSDQATLVTLGPLTPSVLLGLAGLVIMIVLELRRVTGAILIGVLGVTALGFLIQGMGWAQGLVSAPVSVWSSPADIREIAFQLHIWSVLRWGMIGAIFSFMFVDLFDSVGSIVACGYQAGLIRKDGSIARVDNMLQADALATVAGALVGTSTTTTYIESGSGIAVGGRTGLTSVFTSLFFLLALPLSGLVGAVPVFATAPALIMVGTFMFMNIKGIDFQNFDAVVPAFITMVMIPLTYSISTGMAFGFLAHILVMIATSRIRRIHPLMWGIGALSVLDLYVRTMAG